MKKIKSTTWDNIEFIIILLVMLFIMFSFVVLTTRYDNAIKANEELKNRISVVEKQRDILSDALRYSNDCYKDNDIINYSEYYLELIDCNIDSLYSWSYCY